MPDKPYQVFLALGTGVYLVRRSLTDGFLYDAPQGVAAGEHVRPGSALAHMGGETEWDQLHNKESLPLRLVAIMTERGMTFEPGDLLP